MRFRKISADEPEYKKLKNQFESVYHDFYQFAENLSIKSGKIKVKSGKASSYARYLIKLLLLYLENNTDYITRLDSLETFNKLEVIKFSPNFNEYNRENNNFPSATLSCYKSYIINKFTLNEEFIDYKYNDETNSLFNNEENNPYYFSDKLVSGAQPSSQLRESKAGYFYQRNQNETLYAKQKSNYKCVIDSSHITFTSEKTQNAYVEAHHIIPMYAQEYFKNTIDFADNIAVLCPNCHRKIHYATQNEKQTLIKHLFNLRKDIYPDYGIEINLELLLSFYNIP